MGRDGVRTSRAANELSIIDELQQETSDAARHGDVPQGDAGIRLGYLGTYDTL